MTGIATCTACGKIIVFLNDCYADLEVPASINGTLRVIPKRVVLKGLRGDCASEQ